MLNRLASSKANCHSNFGKNPIYDSRLYHTLEKFKQSLKSWNSISRDTNKESLLNEPQSQFFTVDNLVKSRYNPNGNGNIVNKGDMKNLKESEECKNLIKENLIALNHFRIIVLNGIPSNTNINSILSQIRGGPLEKVLYKNNKSYSNVDSSVCEIHFIYPKDAKFFYTYATTSKLFVLHGKNIQVQWADRKNSEDFQIVHPILPSYLQNEIKIWGARRCLVFTKNPPENPRLNKPRDHKLHYPNAHSQYSNFINPKMIRNEFEKFGEIIDISPVISRKICFAVVFADIRSAIVAKKMCETLGSLVNIKFKEWSVWYGKDPVDRICYLP